MTLAILLLVPFFGCSTRLIPSHIAVYEVELLAVSDDGSLLQGVAAHIGQRALGTTNLEGAIRFFLDGYEGQSTSIDVKCPHGYGAPESANWLRLAHTRSVDTQSEQPLRIETVCTRVYRDVVIVVHAERAGEIPVTVEGKTASVTSADGFAQVLLSVDRSVRSITVGLETAARANLKPRNPTRKYDMSFSDAILVFDQKFQTTRQLRARVAASKENRHIPYRVD